MFPEAAKILVKALNIASAQSQSEIAASDDHPTQFWYKPFTDDLARLHAIPMTITNFEHQITRGEMAEMIYRLRAGFTDLPTQTYDGLGGNPPKDDSTMGGAR